MDAVRWRMVVPELPTCRRTLVMTTAPTRSPGSRGSRFRGASQRLRSGLAEGIGVVVSWSPSSVTSSGRSGRAATEIQAVRSSGPTLPRTARIDDARLTGCGSGPEEHEDVFVRRRVRMEGDRSDRTHQRVVERSFPRNDLFPPPGDPTGGPVPATWRPSAPEQLSTPESDASAEDGRSCVAGPSAERGTRLDATPHTAPLPHPAN